MRTHATKAGVWGKITVVSGQLRYRIPEIGLDVILDPRTEGGIAPEQPHQVEPIGAVSFYVEFWR